MSLHCSSVYYPALFKKVIAIHRTSNFTRVQNTVLAMKRNAASEAQGQGTPSPPKDGSRKRSRPARSSRPINKSSAKAPGSAVATTATAGKPTPAATATGAEPVADAPPRYGGAAGLWVHVLCSTQASHQVACMQVQVGGHVSWCCSSRVCKVRTRQRHNAATCPNVRAATEAFNPAALGDPLHRHCQRHMPTAHAPLCCAAVAQAGRHLSEGFLYSRCLWFVAPPRHPPPAFLLFSLLFTRVSTVLCASAD